MKSTSYLDTTEIYGDYRRLLFTALNPSFTSYEIYLDALQISRTYSVENLPPLFVRHPPSLQHTLDYLLQ